MHIPTMQWNMSTNVLLEYCLIPKLLARDLSFYLGNWLVAVDLAQ